jgi:glycosyltransferase involved in cell wall biosynthesis
MSLKLISHVNRDSDLIEAWLKYYMRLGVDRFHLVLHGEPDENYRLLAIKDSYPVTIEDSYTGSFHVFEKKDRLNAVLSQHAGQWLLLVDSDEFVEFPYENIRATIEALKSAQANLMAAPMLQRMTIDGSLETPVIIDDPFHTFPVCSEDLYRRMGVKADTFKFPLFFCVAGTQLKEGGNHYPPLGQEPRGATVRGVTHHFKFRRTVSERLDKRIHSEHPWRYESVQFQDYLQNHSNRLPLDGSFLYSRDELFRRHLLKELPPPSFERCRKSVTPSPAEKWTTPARASAGSSICTESGKDSRAQSVRKGARALIVLPQNTEFEVFEKHLIELVAALKDPKVDPLVICFGHHFAGERLDYGRGSQVVVKCVKEPESLSDWLHMIREAHPAITVLIQNSIETFSWKVHVAALLAGVPRRFVIHTVVAPSPSAPAQGWSPRNMLRRLIGRRARHLLKIRIAGSVSSKTICVSRAVREVLVNSYRFPRRKTITIPNGVSTSAFVPSKNAASGMRNCLGIGPEEFLLVCTARLVEVKGVDILLQAVSRVVRQGVSCKCVILGDGPLKEKLVEQTNSLGLWDSVYFEGFQRDVRPYLHAASAFILTSRIEGLPLSILEAMACGLPCIVTNVGGNAEAVRDKKVGIVVPSESVEDAADAILYLATHPRERARMAVSSRETVCEHYNSEKRIDELMHAMLM